MYFDDEKDNLNGIENSQDDVISWDGIIDTDEDGIVSIKNNTSSDIPTEVFSNDVDINLDEENVLSEIVGESDEDVSYSNEDGEIDEEEIKRILNSGSSDSSDVDKNSSVADNSDLADIETNNPVDDEILPRKNETKDKKTTSPVLLALLVGVLVAVIIYFVMNNFVSQKSDDIPAVLPPNQEQLNTDNQIDNQSMPEQQQANENIPVVNEEEVSDLKPDEKQEEEPKEEKKEVVSVIPTGRANPFMPLTKYVPKADLVTKTINSIDYDSINIPKPPKEYGTLNEYTDKLMSIVVSGIMYDKVKPSAIINYENDDYFVQVGDRLNNFKIVEIGPTYVKIALGKNVYKANVGEEFIINTFYGNVPYKNGARQYYSSEDEFTSSRDNPVQYENRAKTTGDYNYINKNDVVIRRKNEK